MSGSNDTRRTVVVGAGLAGVRCALTLRRLDPERMIVLVGDEPHDTYERPPLSKEFLLGTRDHHDLRLAGCDRDALRDAGIDLRLGERVAGIEPGLVTLAGGEQLTTDSIVLATGARPRRIPISADPARVHVLRSLDDATRLRDAVTPGSRLVIVGSGFVGAEVAGSAHALGAHVTLVEAAPVPFERTLGATAGEWLVDRWREAGIDVRIGAPVAAIAHGGSDAPVRVSLAGDEELQADHVLVAIGTVPNDELFHEAFPAISAPGRGIPVDADGRTPIAGVYAVGDAALVHDDHSQAARRVEHWTDAAAGAQRLARVIAGHEPGARPAPYAWSDQFGLRVQVTGHVDPEWEVIVDEATADTLLVRYVDTAGRLRGVTAVGHAATVARYRGELQAAAA